MDRTSDGEQEMPIDVSYRNHSEGISEQQGWKIIKLYFQIIDLRDCEMVLSKSM
jgi:hypothetical protein